jgi:hypothetical protein
MGKISYNTDQARQSGLQGRMGRLSFDGKSRSNGLLDWWCSGASKADFRTYQGHALMIQIPTKPATSNPAMK